MNPGTYVCVEGQKKFDHQIPGLSGDMGGALSSGCTFGDGQPHFLIGEPVSPNVVEGSHVGEDVFRIHPV